MWIFRELYRLLVTIVLVAGVAAALASLWALISSGDLVNNMRIGFFLFGGILLLCAGAGNRATAQNRAMRYTWFMGIRGYGMFSPGRARPNQPTLTASAVFFASAIALFVLGAVA
jgi:hypothetical protein